MNQPETTLRKARALAKSLGHDLVRFRKTHTHAQAAYCRHCFKYAFIVEGEVRGGQVVTVATRRFPPGAAGTLFRATISPARR